MGHASVVDHRGSLARGRIGRDGGNAADEGLSGHRNPARLLPAEHDGHLQVEVGRGVPERGAPVPRPRLPTLLEPADEARRRARLFRAGGCAPYGPGGRESLTRRVTSDDRPIDGSCWRDSAPVSTYLRPVGLSDRLAAQQGAGTPRKSVSLERGAFGAHQALAGDAVALRGPDRSTRSHRLASFLSVALRGLRLAKPLGRPLAPEQCSLP